MGGKKSSSKSSTATTTTTNTNTTVGDIGFTGQQAVDLAAVLELGGVEREQIVADTLNQLIQTAGAGYQQLVGGAGSLVETGRSLGQAQAEAGVYGSDDSPVSELNLNKALPYIAVGIALFAASKTMK